MQKTTKNIVICVPFFSLGGAETQAYNIAKGFKEAGHNVTVVAFDEKSGLLRKKLGDLGINCELIPYQLNWVHEKGAKKFLGLLKVIFFLRKFKPDFLFPFTYYPNIILSSIWRFTGAKKCFWNQRGLEQNSMLVVEKLASKMTSCYLSNSNVGAEYIAKRHGVSADEIRVVRNGVELKRAIKSPGEWRKDLRIGSEKIYTMVANFYPEKNHDYLLDAWSAYSSGSGDKKLLLVGYAPNEELLWRIKAKLYDLNISNVIVLDSTQDVTGLLAITDYGLLTSSSEGCPNSVLEMMKKKIPVVVSSISAHKEIFGDEYALYCELENVESLKLCFEKLHKESNWIAAVVEENYELVNDVFSVERLKDEYLCLLK